MRAFSEILKFLLERWIQRGVLHQLLFVAGLIVAVAVGGGLLAWGATERFADPWQAVWWSFLRLTDPGYLGDDEGLVLRAVSTAVTVLGYILFLGSLIAIMTQWLSTTLRRLESGHTPISMHGHVVILGWTNRTAEIVRQLLDARGRLRRFLDEHGERTLRVVVLAEQVDAGLRRDLRDHVGALWRENRVFLRTGSSLEAEDLVRLDLRRASAVVLPGADFELGGAELTDARAVKTLLTLRRLLQPVPIDERPVVVTEIRDPYKLEIAESALPDRLEVIASDAVLSRLISQSVRHPGLAEVFLELLTLTDGNSIYVRRCPELAGAHPVAGSRVFPRAKVLGAVRVSPEGLEPHLDPPEDFRLEPEDLVVFIALRYEDCVPSAAPAAAPEPIGPAVIRCELRPLAILVLGWSYKVSTMLAELSASSAERFEVAIVSRVPTAEREAALAHVPLDAERVRVEHVEGDYTVVSFLESIRLERFASVVFLAGAGMQTSEEADARTILGYVLLLSRLLALDAPPQVLVELLDPANGKIFADSDDVILVSSRILSHILSHVCLRPELNAVYGELFVAGGPEFAMRRAAEYGLEGATATFAEVERRARQRGEIGLGVMTAGARRAEGLCLNPGPDRTWTFGAGDQLVVLANALGNEREVPWER